MGTCRRDDEIEYFYPQMLCRLMDITPGQQALVCLAIKGDHAHPIRNFGAAKALEIVRKPAFSGILRPTDITEDTLQQVSTCWLPQGTFCAEVRLAP